MLYKNAMFKQAVMEEIEKALSDPRVIGALGTGAVGAGIGAGLGGEGKRLSGAAKGGGIGALLGLVGGEAYKEHADADEANEASDQGKRDYHDQNARRNRNEKNKAGATDRTKEQMTAMEAGQRKINAEQEQAMRDLKEQVDSGNTRNNVLLGVGGTAGAGALALKLLKSRKGGAALGPVIEKAIASGVLGGGTAEAAAAAKAVGQTGIPMPGRVAKGALGPHRLALPPGNDPMNASVFPTTKIRGY